MEKNGGRFFRRPKLILSCRAVEKEGKTFIARQLFGKLIPPATNTQATIE
jgi:hypothetical protein